MDEYKGWTRERVADELHTLSIACQELGLDELSYDIYELRLKHQLQPLSDEEIEDCIKENNLKGDD